MRRHKNELKCCCGRAGVANNSETAN